MGLCLGQDGFAAAGGVLSNMHDGLLYAVHDLDREDVVQKFGVKVLFAGRRANDYGGGALIKTKLYRMQTLCNAVRAKPLGQTGKKLPSNGRVHKAHFLGVAHAGAAG